MGGLLEAAMMNTIGQGAQDIGKSYSNIENQKYLDYQNKLKLAFNDYNLYIPDPATGGETQLSPLTPDLDKIIKGNPNIRVERKSAGISYGIRQKLDENGKPIPNETEAYDLTTGQPITRPLSSVDKNVIKPPTSMQNKAVEVTLENATPQQINVAQGIVDGTVEVGKLPMRPDSPINKGSMVSLSMELAKKQGKDYTTYRPDVNAKMAGYMTSGLGGQNATAINTAAYHISTLMPAYTAMKNTDINLLNKPINWLKTNSNNPDVIALDTNINAVVNELAKVFKGSGVVNEEEIRDWRKQFNANLTPNQVQGLITKAVELMKGRIGALEYQKQQGMGTVQGNQLISPNSQKVFNDFSVNESTGIPINQGHPAIGQNFNGAKITNVEEVK